MSREKNKIIIHCSDSHWGNADAIDDWHKQRGWNGIGYHFVINNGYPTYASWNNKKLEPSYDGLIELGRDIEIAGAHAKGSNKDSIGICLIGKNKFNLTPLYVLLYTLVESYSIPIGNVIGHNETNSGKSQGKTCPNFDVQKVREHLIWLLLSRD